MSDNDDDSDPKLEQALEEILEIVKKNDLGATVILTSPTHAEAGARIPEWSVIKYDGEVYRIGDNLPEGEQERREALRESMQHFTASHDMCKKLVKRYADAIADINGRLVSWHPWSPGKN